MKKINILIIAILFANIAQSQIINIPDANFKAALLSNSNLDDNGDGEIQISEAQSFTGVLHVENQNISDLTGIEYFTSPYLSSLSCNGNNLTNLDLHNNTNFTHLYCYDNNLTTLDLSSNIYIMFLKCGNNPNLSYINLKNTNNSHFDVYGGIASDFENLPNLQNVCVDALNTDLTNFIITETGHTVNFSTDCTALSVSEEEVTLFNIYPNPASNNIKISSKNEIKTISIYNEFGKLLAKIKGTNGIDVSNLMNGIYLLKITDEFGNIATKKIMKQ